jgi:hypothetical protein
VPTALATGQTAPWGVTVDAANAYWSASGMVARAALGSVATDAGVPAYASDSKTPQPVAVDATGIYWGDTAGAVMKCGLGGCSSPTTLINSGILQGAIEGLAIDGSNVYVTSLGLITGAGQVLQVGKNGNSTSATILANLQSAPTGIAVDSANVYWANNGAGTISRIPIGGGSAVNVATGQSGPAGVAVDGTFVYWTNETGGTVMRLAK